MTIRYSDAIYLLDLGSREVPIITTTLIVRIFCLGWLHRETHRNVLYIQLLVVVHLIYLVCAIYIATLTTGC